MEHIKINIPRTEEDFISGNGEGVWVLVEDDVHEKYHNDYVGGIFYGILHNDSVYFKELKFETKVPFTMRGKNRGVVLWDGFLENYEAISEDKLLNIMQEIREYHRNILTSKGNEE